MRRPSPALVIALIALVGTWGGSAVAAQIIRSRDIKDRTIQGRDVKSNTLTGRVVSGLSSRDLKRNSLDGTVIDESSLAEVPRAGAAGRADSAAKADALAGAQVKRVLYAPLVGDATTPVLDEGGLRLEGRCTGSGTLSVTAVASGSVGGVLHVSATRPGSGATGATAVASDNDLRAGDTVNVLPAGADGATGTLVFFSPAGDTITVDYLAQDTLGAGRGYQCLFSGTAVHATA